MALTACFRKKLADFTLDVSFTAEADGLLGLLGASGSGKSMTLKCIAGVETPDEGHIELDGVVLYDSSKKCNLPSRRRHVGYLFQNYALFPNLTARENIALAAPRENRDAIVAEQLRAFHLDGLEDRRPGRLSGGQQQRVALARLFASRPSVLLLDEPLSALDSYLRWQVELELSDTLAAFRGPKVLVSHSRDEVYRLCRSVCVLQGGLSQPQTPVKALFDAPETVAACLLSGCKNLADARPSGRTLLIPQWGASLSLPRPVPPEITHVGVRAHYLRLARGESENVVPCTVARVVEDVFSTVVMLQTPGPGQLRWELSKEEWAAVSGLQVYPICISPQAIMLLHN